MKLFNYTILAVLFLTTLGLAQTKYKWNGSSGTWYESNKWIPTGVPGTQDTVELNGGTVTLDSIATVSKLLLGTTNGGSILQGNGVLSVTDSIVWRLGLLTGPGAFTLVNKPTSTTLFYDNITASRTVGPGTTFINEGTVIHTGGGSLTLQGSLTNRGTYNLLDNGYISGTNGLFVNDAIGSVIKTGASETAEIGSFFDNQGNVQAQNGTLQILNTSTGAEDNGTFNVFAGAFIKAIGVRNVGNISISGDGYFLIAGTLNFNGSSIAENVKQVPFSTGGSIEGAGSLIVTKTLIDSVGVIGGNLTVTIAPGAQLIWDGPTSSRGIIENGKVINDGIINWLGGATAVSMVNLVNNNIFNIQLPVGGSGASSVLTNNASGVINFNSSGTITINGTTNNDGLIDVNSGLFSVGAGTSNGIFDLAQGSTVKFAFQHNLTTSSLVKGNGSIDFTNASQTQNATFSPGASIGQLISVGVFSISSSGNLNIEIESASSYDKIVANTASVLNGTLNVSLLNNFVPAQNDTFKIVTHTADQGNFAGVNLPSIPAPLYWNLVENSSGIYLIVKDSTTTGIESENNSILAEYSLSQNYPNPFNPVTTIKYSIPNSGLVTLAVYNILGEQVKTLINQEMPAGNQTVQFNASNLASGIYLYKLQTGNFVETKKMILIK